MALMGAFMLESLQSGLACRRLMRKYVWRDYYFSFFFVVGWFVGLVAFSPKQRTICGVFMMTRWVKAH
jgi:hypothetical protein